MAQKAPSLKPLSRGAIGAALERAERYRLLNEPRQAESICLDILTIDPENQEALVLLLLSITDAFSESTEGTARALALLPRLSGAYSRTYYKGLIHERRARAIVARGGPGSGYVAHADVTLAYPGKGNHTDPGGNPLTYQVGITNQDFTKCGSNTIVLSALTCCGLSHPKRDLFSGFNWRCSQASPMMSYGSP